MLALRPLLPPPRRSAVLDQLVGASERAVALDIADAHPRALLQSNLLSRFTRNEFCLESKSTIGAPGERSPGPGCGRGPPIPTAALLTPAGRPGVEFATRSIQARSARTAVPA